MQDEAKELFAEYEIKNWNFSPRIYKILGASAVFNILAILVFAQTNMLTRKGCESPLVSRVCQVLDTVYVGSLLFDTDSEYVSRDYQKTELEDAEITYIDVSNETPPLTYPEGYFALANPEEFAAMQNADGDFSTMQPFDPSTSFSQTPNVSNGNDLMATPQVTPTPNNNAIQGIIPDSPFSYGSSSPAPARNRRAKVYTPKPLKNKNDSPKELPKLDGDETAENDEKDKKDEKEANANQAPVESDAVKEVEINKKPLQDLADMVLAKWSSKEVDLNQPFIVVMNGALTNDGKLDTKLSKWDPKQEKGDPKMIAIAKEAVESVGDSGWLGYLRNVGVEKIKITLFQDKDRIVATIESEQKSPEAARTIASGLNGLLLGAKLASKGDDEKTLLGSAKTPTANGKIFTMNFEIPKPVGQEMINRKLQEAQTKKNQPNSTAQTENTNLKSAK